MPGRKKFNFFERMDKKWALASTFLLALYLDTTIAKTNIYDNLKVKSGTGECISDCTHNASGNRSLTVLCFIQECANIQKALSASQQPEIEEVYLEYYTDKAEKKNKLALHIEWSPVDNISLESGTGFMINISDGTSAYSRCYHIITPQDSRINKHDTYINDCFGKVRGTFVKPGSDIMVNITSLPINADDPTYGLTEAVMKVPECDDPSMLNVTNCIELNSSDILTAEVESMVCENRSMVYSYEVSPRYGQYAAIVFCEMGQDFFSCKNRTVMEYLPLSNTLYNISLQSSASLALKYTVSVYGSDYPNKRHTVYPDFSVCIGESPSIIVIIMSILGVLTFCICIFVVCFRYRKDKKLGNHHTVSVPMAEMQPLTPKPTVHIPDDITVFVIFADDHDPDEHKEVVYLFCCYLKKDLGFNVSVSFWSEDEDAYNTVDYVLTNLKEADKVIIICSEGCDYCLKTNNNNIFAPAVKNIRDNTSENPEKYFVVYFDYSKYEHIPEFLLHDQRIKYFSIFKLMEQFEQLYFRLVGIEQYQEQGIVQIDKIMYQKYHILADWGKHLRESIIKMTEFVENNPNWYKDQFDEEILVIPPPSLSTKSEKQQNIEVLDFPPNGQQASVTGIQQQNIDPLFDSLFVLENGTEALLSQNQTTEFGLSDG